MNIAFIPNLYFKSNPKFNSFKKEVESEYRSYKLNEVIDEVIADDTNILGEGNSKIAFAIPGIEKFVIAKMKNMPRTYKEIESCDETLPKYSFGEPIASNGADIIIMEKVEGVPHSLPFWDKKFKNLLQGVKPTQKDARYFLSIIGKIEKFPFESYIDLAQKIKYLSDNNIKMDCGNANNMLVDYKNQKFNLIDQTEGQDKYEVLKSPKNTTQDMISILLDAVLHCSLLEQLDDDDKQLLKSYSRSIIQKCKSAGEIAGLVNDNTNVVKMHIITSQTHLGDDTIPKIYNEFEETYKADLFD